MVRAAPGRRARYGFVQSSWTAVDDLGPGNYASRINKDRKTRNHVRQLKALGLVVTLAPAAWQRPESGSAALRQMLPRRLASLISGLTTPGRAPGTTRPTEVAVRARAGPATRSAIRRRPLLTAACPWLP
jgi:hypothetical protein